MFSYFAAAGHTLYTKSTYIYCQQMQDLPNTHAQGIRSFLNGLNVVRRSDRFWAGLSTDLIIEQVLMRSVKTTGELTRGRGMSETQRLVWLMPMPACADIYNSMQNLTDTNFQQYSLSAEKKPIRLRVIPVQRCDWCHSRRPR